MTGHPIHFQFDQRLVMIGYGSIGKGVLPLLIRHLGLTPDRISVLNAEDAGRAEVEAQGIAYRHVTITPDNYRDLLPPLLASGDILLNLAVDVSSIGDFSKGIPAPNQILENRICLKIHLNGRCL